MIRCLLFCTTALMLLALQTGNARANTITIEFDPSELGEVTSQPADGQSVLGVDFGFTIGGASSPSGATYGAPGPDPASVTFLSTPVLEGDPSGVLSLSFAEPTTLLGFALAFPLIGGIGPAAYVELFEGATSIATIAVSTATQAGSIWSEAEFLWSDSEAAVTQVILSFDQVNVIDDPFINAFWLDNLTFEQSMPVPEPGTFLLVAIGLVGFGLRSRGARA